MLGQLTLHAVMSASRLVGTWLEIFTDGAGHREGAVRQVLRQGPHHGVPRLTKVQGDQLYMAVFFSGSL